MSLSPTASEALRQAYLELYLLSGCLLDGRVSAEKVESIRQQGEQALAVNRKRLFRAGVPEEWVDESQFPVVGLIDEAARRCPVEGVADRWRSLQFPLYGHEEVGREAFERLEKLRVTEQSPVEVLEIYARCLAMGFNGKYAPDALDDLKLVEEGLKNDIIRRLGVLPPLTPHLTSTTGAAEAPRFLEPKWVAAIALLLLILLALGLTTILAIAARQAEGELSGLTEEPSSRSSGSNPGQGGP